MKKLRFSLIMALLATVTSLLWLMNVVADVALKWESPMNSAINVLVALLWAAVAVLWWLRWRRECR